MKLFERVSPDSAIIAILIAVTICVRLVSFAYLSSLASANPQAHPYPVVAGDSSHYARWAGNLLELRAYEDPPGVSLRAAPPGYPALLAATKAVTGNMAWIVVMQTLLAALASILIYRMARTLLPTAYALVPALVYAIDPMVVFTDSAVMTDGIFSSLLICTVYLAFFQSRVKGIARWGLIGFMLGAITMIRPIAQFLVFIFPAMYLLREWFMVSSSNPVTVSSSNPLASKQTDSTVQRENGSRWKAVLACVIGFAFVVTPWIARNYSQFRSFEISPLGGHNLLTFNVRGYLAWRALADSPEPLPAILVLRHANDPVFSDIEKEMRDRLAEMTPPGGNPDNYEGALAVEYIMRDPLRYAYFHAVNTVPFFLSSSVANYRQIARQLGANEEFYAPAMLSLLGSLQKLRNPENIGDFLNAARSAGPVVLEVMWWAALSVLALAALALSRKNFTVLLLAVLVAYFAVLTGPMSMSRYRIPAEPYLLILAVTGFYLIATFVKDKLRSREMPKNSLSVS